MSRTIETRIDRLRVGDFYMSAYVNGHATRDAVTGVVTEVAQTHWLVTCGFYRVTLHDGTTFQETGDTRCHVERG